MSVNYSQSLIDARLDGVVSALGASATLVVSDGATVLVVIPLLNPVGTVAGGVLTITPPPGSTAATASGTANTAEIRDSSNATAVSGFTVGVPGSGAQVIISNGANTLAISASQTVSLISAQIVGA